jgi:hypothetical protein
MHTGAMILQLFLFVHSPAVEIKIPGDKIIGRPVQAGMLLQENGVFLRPQDFVVVKGLVESSQAVCDYVIQEAQIITEEAIRAAHQECETTQFDSQTLIELLTAQSEDLKIKLAESKSRTQIAKYAAIGLGAVALGASAYLIAR